MTSACISEPISYLRLEHYLLDEITAREKSELEAHLAECEACHACFETLRADRAVLLPLLAKSLGAQPMSLPRRLGKTWRRTLLASALTCSMVAAVLLFRRDAPAPALLDSRGGRAKGGQIAITLVREHEGSVATDPSVFVSGDRFEVQVSCLSVEKVRWDLVVLQGGQVFFPLQANTLVHCGNHVTLPGAFRLTGDSPARVCVVLGGHQAVDRAQIGPVLSNGGELHSDSACAELMPASSH